MLTADELAKLPDNPEMAFVQLVEILDRWLESALAREEANARERYVEMLRAFADEYELDAAEFRRLSPTAAKFNSWLDYFDEFRSEVAYTSGRLRFRHRTDLGAVVTSSVELNNARRDEIHKLTLKIRKVVAVLDIPEAKRDAIYKRVAALDREVDQSKTRYGTLMALVLETCGTLGESAKKLEPVAKLVQKINAHVADQKAESELAALPEAPEQKQIAPPRERQSPPAELDDGVPF